MKPPRLDLAGEERERTIAIVKRTLEDLKALLRPGVPTRRPAGASRHASAGAAGGIRCSEIGAPTPLKATPNPMKLLNLPAFRRLPRRRRQAADSYPTKSIELVVSYQPGGGSDNTARAIADAARP